MTKRHKKERRDVEVSISSFSDIAFLLIIFFILATTLVHVSGVINEIPSGEQSKSNKEFEAPTVKLQNGSVLFNDKAVSMDELRKELTDLELHEKQKDAKVVLLEAGADTAYQDYYDVLASVSAAGGVTALLKEEEEGEE